MADFDVNTALKSYLDDPQSILTPEADGTLTDCESDPDAYSPGLINGALNPIVDAIGENPEAIAQAGALDSLQFLLKCVS
jgi:condensin complex subunit 1